MTKYLVFKHNGDDLLLGEDWDVVGEKEAVSAKAAINAVLSAEDKPEDLNGGTYAAVPARSWQPVKVQVETALKFS